MAKIYGSNDDDFIIPTSNGAEYLGLQGDDIYIITNLIAPDAVVKITDTEGTNKIQLAEGLTIASSLFYNNAAVLTLSNNAKIQVTGAAAFKWDIGANAVCGDSTVAPGTTPNSSFDQFATSLGATVPAPGTPPVNGTPDYDTTTGGGGGASGFTTVNLSTGTVAATAVAEAFVYDFQMVNGRPTKAGDGEVTITGFDTAQDKLVFNDVGTGTVYTKEDFLALPGVVAQDMLSDPFSTGVSIYVDPAFGGAAGGVTLTGVTLLSDVTIETLA